MTENFDSFKEIVSEFIVLLIKFSKCKSEEIAIKSLDYLKKMIVKMIQETGSKPVDLDHDTILEESKSDIEIQSESKHENSKATSQSPMSESNKYHFYLF